MSDPNPALNTADAAVYIGQSVSQLRALVRGHKLPAKRTGEKNGLLLFRRADLDFYLDELPEA